MTLDTNLSRRPYFDDFDEKSQYTRVLFKPGTAVQARELNQTQSILQDQINKFGRNIYQEGTVVEGCIFAFDNKSSYVKIEDSYSNGTAFTIADFQDQYLYNSNGLKAIIINTNPGYLSQAPNTNTLYVKYLNSASYANGDQQSTFDASEVITIRNTTNTATIGYITVASNTNNANVGDPTGKAYIMSTTEGVIFKKGAFLYVPKQSVLVSPYNNLPDGVSVGFEAVESIDTAQSNSALYDNAVGSPNYSAPGADRFKIAPQLVVRDTVSIANTKSFFSIADFKNGAAVTLRQTAQYSTLGAEMARRTYETNGDFVVTPFLLTTKSFANTQSADYLTKVNLLVGRGLGYVNGYRVEYLNNNVANLRKSTETNSITGQIVTTNFGFYVPVHEYVGEFASSTELVKVELHAGTGPIGRIPKKAITTGDLLNVSTTGTKIGTAYIRGVSFGDGVPGLVSTSYRLYLFDIVMDGGKNFADSRSIIYKVGSDVKGVADITLTYNATTNSMIAELKETYNSGMIFPFGQRALTVDGFGTSASFTYKRKTSSSFDATGAYAVVSLPTVYGTASESIEYVGNLSGAEKENILVIPTATGNTSNFAHSVDVLSDNTAVRANSGTGSFLSQYQVGDYITVDTEPRVITYIANNTYLEVLSPFTANANGSSHHLSFPKGVPIPLSNRENRTVITTSTSANIALGVSLRSSFNVDVFYNVKRYNTVPIKKTIKRDVYVKIDCSTHPKGALGAWSLGIPDVINIQAIYINNINDADPWNDTGTNYVSSFRFLNGQTDSMYDLATIDVGSNSPAYAMINRNSTLLVKLTHYSYQQSEGVGFFTANSYPINDSSFANTLTITTAEIPMYTTSKGSVFDLRDCVDFRPFAANTAVSTTSIGSATINPNSTTVVGPKPYLPIPDSNFSSDLSYYLQRIDRVALDTGGSIVVVEGTPDATNPKAPNQRDGTMTLGLMVIPPYPSLSTSDAKRYNRYDYAITATLQQNKRFTMRDIGVLEKRIENLEYYTSLSLLESSASTLQVRSGTTGQNRFQNGFFVDPFKGFDLADTANPAFMIAMDAQRTELRPAFAQWSNSLQFDPVRSTGVQLHGEMVMLDHTSDNLYISQDYASKYRNCIEGNIFQWQGTVDLNPPGNMEPDRTKSPDIINNVDLASNWANLGNAWPTQWGQWVNQGSPASTAATSSKTNSVTNKDGSINNTTVSKTVVTTQQKQQRSGTQLSMSGTADNSYNLGNFVSDINILPYLKPLRVKFAAHGLKPNTRVYAYFSKVSVSSHCAPMRSDYTFTGNPGERNSGFYGDAMYTDDSGSCYGVFYIPENTFKSEENVFEINDISSLSMGADAIKTKATTTFYGSKLSFATASSTLSTRTPVFSTTEVYDTQTVTGTTNDTDVTVNTIPAPLPPPPLPAPNIYINNTTVIQNTINNIQNTTNITNNTTNNQYNNQYNTIVNNDTQQIYIPYVPPNVPPVLGPAYPPQPTYPEPPIQINVDPGVDVVIPVVIWEPPPAPQEPWGAGGDGDGGDDGDDGDPGGCDPGDSPAGAAEDSCDDDGDDGDDGGE